MKTITRAKGGTKERKVRVDKIKIPDVWTVVHRADNDINAHDKELLVDCWHLTHDLLRAVKEAP